MQIFDSLDEIYNLEPSAIALGNFDGVHLGHRKLIEKTVEYAANNGLKAAVFTFSNHPRDLLPNAPKVKNILYKHEKEELMEAFGVDYLINIPFTKEIMQMLPRDYVQKIILEKLKAKCVVCGFNHNFGFKASGNVDLLYEMSIAYGFELRVIEPYTVNGQVVSSTLIRNLIATGRVDECETYMGRPYAIGGEVVVGNRLGRKLGFPTSNLVIDDNMVTPPNGVYVTYCVYNGKKYPSVTNVGVKPTIGNYVKNVETHIFDFDKILYGKKITVEFLKKTRDEIKFSSIEELSKQIISDCNQARNFHETKGFL
ncbi:MAG: bifunctional riboflavin kinase/FAD synthetase [Eubacterium sp.]|nr:bifunctional riboflavin kinase/FAD synthetase [Eubacterium sp.]